MSFAQWHKKHTVPLDSCSQRGLSLSFSVIDLRAHTLHTGSCLDTLGPFHCQHGKEINKVHSAQHLFPRGS